MTKRIYILLTIIFGFALTPSVTFACGSKTEKSCCKKENSKKSETKDCCKKDNQHSNDKDDCGRECGDNSCHCPAFYFSLTTSLFQESANINFDFLDEKQNFFHIETYLPSGFHSIWTPPNIG